MDLDPFADPLQQHDGQLSSKVLAELLQPGEDRRGPIESTHVQFMDVQREPNRADEIEDSVPIRLRKQTAQMSVGRIEGEADSHCFAVPQLIVRKLLQLVRRPVTKVERT